MTIYLKQSTAVNVPIGQLLSSTDGTTLITTPISDSDIYLYKHGGTSVSAKNDTGDSIDMGQGVHYTPLSQTDTNTVGTLILYTKPSGALATRQEFCVLAANVYDSLIGGGGVDLLDISVVQIAGAAVSTTTAQLGVNVVQISEDATAANNAESFFDGTGYAGTNNVIPLVTTTTTATTATNLTNLPAVTADWLTASGVKADAVTKIQNGLATPTNITAGTITTVTNLTNAPTNGDLTATMKSSVTAAVPTAATISDAVWDEASTGHTDAGKAGAQMWTDIDAILEDTGTTLDDLIDSEIATIVSELAKVPKSDSTVTWNATALASINAEVDTALNTAIPASNTANSVNDILLDQITFTVAKQVDVNVVDWKGSAAAAMTGDAYALIGATGSGLTSLAQATELAKVPKSDSTVTWNSTALASINAEVDTALNTAIPGSPTSDSINERVKAIDDLTQASGSGDLAAILTDTGTTLDGLIDDIKALVGGYSLSSPVFNADGNMTSATITANGKTYTVTATYDVDTNLATYAIAVAP